MMNFPLNLPATGMQPVYQVGNYVYYSAGSAGGADPSIKVKTDLGDEYILKPGQGFRLDGRNFGNLQISNAGGVATIIGMVTIADGGFFDNRVTGSVEVIDGAKARTLGGGALMGGVTCGAVAATNAYVQLWNPAGSGKNVIVETVAYSSNTTGGVGFRTGQTAITNFQGNGISKLAGGASSGVSLRYQNNAAAMGGANMLLVSVSAGQQAIYTFKEPVVLPPGNGLIVTQGIVNADITASFEWYEESNA